MKKMCIFFVLIVTLSLQAQENYSTSPDNFSFLETIKSLNIDSDTHINDLIENKTWIILDGSLSSITRLSGRNEDYLLEALLVQGEWRGLDQVLKYECKLIFRGNNWKEIVPDKTPRKVKEGMILLNSHVLVLGKVVSFENMENRKIPYLLVEQIRVIP
ncbi:MAG: hypothetical protein B6241_08480 [Spirochaetaceae bacterium 4572_59]|nr:MAG: hypothetical protein B6241_08480 [Spirochaetaceae bacterium 4572_59]